MSLYKIVRSKGYKNFMAKLYGWGASAVIAGALFKILHWPGADYMLMVGMGTEALIFFFSAFEPLHKEYDWALVYPELGLTEDAQGKPFKGSVTHQLDNMLAEAKIEPALIESLASGMRNLSENAKKLSYTTDAAMATQGYTDNLSKAKDALQNLTGVYAKSADAISASSEMQAKSTQDIIDVQKQHAQKLQNTLSETTEMQVKSAKELFDIQKQHTQKLQTTLNETTDTQLTNVQELFVIQKQHAQTLQDAQIQSAQKIGQIQEQGTQAIMENYKKIENVTAQLANSMQDSIQEAQQYKIEIDKLSKHVAQINSIYANMLAAMTNK
jgi:gliding motility-associated protein GldL